MKSLFFLSFLFLQISLKGAVPWVYNHGKGPVATNQREVDLIHHVKTSILNANLGISKLQGHKILALEGMSSSKVRHFLNNMCSKPETAYLEIGVWKGSTFISALYGNELNLTEATAIDNWSEFSGHEQIFLRNCDQYLNKNEFKYHNIDSFKLTKKDAFKYPVNVYFYDGNHSIWSQGMAFIYYEEVLDDLFVAIVDDWNGDAIRAGTFAAFTKLGFEVLYEEALPSRKNEDREMWWNGLYVAVVRKK